MLKSYHIFILSGTGGLIATWVIEHASLFQGLAAMLSFVSLCIGLAIRGWKWYKK